MTLYEELYYQLSDLPKFYRYEGPGTFRNYNFEGQEILEVLDNYIYFSKTIKHHDYYVQKRIRQLIEKDILYQLINNEKFQEIVSKTETFPREVKMCSIEFTTSPIVKKLFAKNWVFNTNKKERLPYIERVDITKSGGGYGLSKDWLCVFNVLTYIYAHYCINKNDILDFLYAFRRNFLTPDFLINPTAFLNGSQNRSIKINKKLHSNLSKYDLMNALQNIIEKELYFPNSFIANDPDAKIKEIIQNYVHERECILELMDTMYERKLNKRIIT